MSNNKNNIGVITEQGYAAGTGLGFNPVNENDLNKKPNSDRKITKDKEENDKLKSKKN